MAIGDIKKGFGGGMGERPKPFERKQSTPFDRKQPIPHSRPTERKQPTPFGSKTLFEEKKEWHRDEIERKMANASPYIPGTGGAMYSQQELEKMTGKIFPAQKFQSHISEDEAIERLRELRKEESEAPSGAKQLEASRLRRFLEEKTGLQGKY